MKGKLLVGLVLNILVVHAQQHHINGSVIDSQNRLPVPSVTLSIVSKNLFYPADSKGIFDIKDKMLAGEDTLEFSCIGYKTLKIKASDLKPNDVIKLAGAVYNFNEVKISCGPTRNIKVGSEYQSSRNGIAPWPGSDQAAYMDGSKNKKGLIKSVGFYLKNSYGSKITGDVTAPFRIRIFSVDTDGTPGKELTKEVIVVNAKKNNAWFDVDISQYAIQNPDSGFYASFTLLSYDYYAFEKNAQTKDLSGNRFEFGSNNSGDVKAPRLGMVKEKLKMSRSYFSVDRSLDNMKWHWEHDVFNFSYMIRASINEE